MCWLTSKIMFLCLRINGVNLTVYICVWYLYCTTWFHIVIICWFRFQVKMLPTRRSDFLYTPVNIMVAKESLHMMAFFFYIYLSNLSKKKGKTQIVCACHSIFKEMNYFYFNNWKKLQPHVEIEPCTFHPDTKPCFSFP